MIEDNFKYVDKCNMQEYKKNILNILTGARKLIRKKENWIKNMSCCNDKGERCPLEYATRFCVSGAIEHRISTLSCHPFDVYSYRRFIAEMYFGESCELTEISKFNDSPDTTHEDVISFLDYAIEVVENHENDMEV